MRNRITIMYCHFDVKNKSITTQAGKVYKPILFPLQLHPANDDILITLGLYTTARIKFNNLHYKNKLFILDHTDK